MEEEGTLTPRQEGSAAADAEALAHLQRAIADGKHWFIALLEAMALWTAPQEQVDGRHYRYLIGGEAFDWLLLAERLCLNLDGVIPQEEKEALLFNGRPPLEISADEFRRLLGPAKYRSYLNYFYGIAVEEALQLAVEEEVWKAQHCRVWDRDPEADERVFLQIYGKPRRELLAAFREEAGLPQKDSLSLTELREFTYWLFKYRVRACDPAKVASDTRKGLAMLARLEAARSGGPPAPTPSGPVIEL